MSTWIPLMGLLISLLAWCAQPARADFDPPVNYAVGDVPSSVNGADFNNDGHQDIAVANWKSNSISVLIGSTLGKFQAAVNYKTDVGPGSIVAKDFNADGRIDLAVANFFASNVSIFLGNGNGTFQPAVTYATSNGPSGLIASDLNGDGLMDLANISVNQDKVSILTGNGNGTFQAFNTYPAGDGPVGVRAGDFNHDGRQDLVVADNYANAISVLAGKPDGTFQAPVSYPAGNDPEAVQVGDLNGDGNLDVITANTDSDDLSVLLGNPNGTFQTAVSHPAGDEPGSVAIGDVNGDSVLDLVVANGASNKVSVLIGNSNATFQAPIEYLAGNQPVSVHMGDYNHDGQLDLAVANSESDNVSILLASLTDVVDVAGGPESVKVGVKWSKPVTAWVEVRKPSLAGLSCAGSTVFVAKVSTPLKDVKHDLAVKNLNDDALYCVKVHVDTPSGWKEYTRSVRTMKRRVTVTLRNPKVLDDGDTAFCGEGKIRASASIPNQPGIEPGSDQSLPFDSNGWWPNGDFTTICDGQTISAIGNKPVVKKTFTPKLLGTDNSTSLELRDQMWEEDTVYDEYAGLKPLFAPSKINIAGDKAAAITFSVTRYPTDPVYPILGTLKYQATWDIDLHFIP